MSALGAIQPDGIGIVDLHAEHLACLLLPGPRVDRHEAGEDWVFGERLAWFVIAGLRDGVILWIELEVDGVTHFRFYVVRVEDQAITTDFDSVRAFSRGEEGQEGSEGDEG